MNTKILKSLIILCFLLLPLNVSAYNEGRTFSGIGIYNEVREDNIVITNILENTPAEKAGLQIEDVILEVDGENATKSNFQEINTKIRGEEGTIVKLLIKRGEKTIPFIITREKIYDSNYVEIFPKFYLYRQYPKLENGIYYFWMKVLKYGWGDSKNFGYKDFYCQKIYVAIDIQNEKIGLLENIGYNDKGDVLFEYTNDSLDRVIPGSIGYYLFEFMKKILIRNE